MLCIYVIYLNATQRGLTHIGVRRALTHVDIQRELILVRYTECELTHVGIILGSLRWEWVKLNGKRAVFLQTCVCLPFCPMKDMSNLM
jgi:hypothetical protein